MRRIPNIYSISQYIYSISRTGIKRGKGHTEYSQFTFLSENYLLPLIIASMSLVRLFLFFCVSIYVLHFVILSCCLFYFIISMQLCKSFVAAYFVFSVFFVQVDLFCCTSCAGAGACVGTGAKSI